MSDSKPTTTEPLAGRGVLRYRCVCGESIELQAAVGATCTACGRRYAADILENSVAETILVRPDGLEERTLTDADQETAEDPLIDTMVDHYKIVARIGRGGMGAVYRALDTSLERYVALKFIQRDPASDVDTEHLEHLLQEARAQARVNHPHVAHIYYVSRDQDAPFLAMELVQGPTLQQRIAQGPLAYGTVVALAVQIVDALRHAARFDIVHGDIKPSNILFADGDTIKLSDFGLARRLSQPEETQLAKGGTPLYFSPEAVRREGQDIRSDMYSLGLMLFEMTFGRAAYELIGETLLERLQCHLNSAVDFPEPWPDELPEAWRDLLARLLAKSPEDRYQDYDGLLADLERLKPIALPRAGRLLRGMAWFVDVALATAAQEVLYAPFGILAVREFLNQRPVLGLLAACTSLGIPLLTSYLLARLRTSAGKRLFQIRIVGRHGLPPAEAKRAARGVFQVLPVWITAAEYIARDGFRAEWLASGILYVGWSFVLLDAGFAIFSRRCRSLHDMIFGTQVVLDAAGRSTRK